MGLDAVVRCRCWEEGRATPFERPELVTVGCEGFLELSIPWDKASAPIHQRFDIWLDTCCRHPQTHFAQDWIANWFGVSDFKLALNEVDPKRFQTLQNELPSTNGGSTSPEAAASCLVELDEFESAGTFGRVFRVVDSLTGERLQGNSTGDPFMMQGRELEIGADAGGLYVREPHGRELFRAFQVEQVEIAERVSFFRKHHKQFEFIDRNGGARVTTGMAVAVHSLASDGKWVPTYPRFIEVRVEPNSSIEYADLIQRLRKIFRASVEVSSPVLWT